MLLTLHLNEVLHTFHVEVPLTLHLNEVLHASHTEVWKTLRVELQTHGRMVDEKGVWKVLLMASWKVLLMVSWRVLRKKKRRNH